MNLTQAKGSEKQADQNFKQKKIKVLKVEENLSVCLSTSESSYTDI